MCLPFSSLSLVFSTKVVSEIFCTFKMVHLFTMTDKLGIVGLYYIKREKNCHLTEKRRGNVCAVGEIILDFMRLIFSSDKK